MSASPRIMTSVPSNSIRTRRPREVVDAPPIVRDLDIVRSFLEDAAHFPGGHAEGVAFPQSEAEVAAIVRASARVLPIGAQSSLTGGATPEGDVVLSMAKMHAIHEIAGDRVQLEPGVPLAVLQDELSRRNLYYPPAPTFNGAFIGGTVATNAAGAATFKYGTTRPWVYALTMVLASGDVLEVVRGDVTASPEGIFEIITSAGLVRVRVPTYRMPDVPKRSAGYHAAPAMDLIDLFIGSEGTLGVITEITVGVVANPPPVCWAFVPIPTEQQGLELVATLRRLSQETWRSRDARGIDTAAIELLDRRCLELLHEDGIDHKFGVRWPTASALALLIQLELPAGMTPAHAYDQIGAATSPGAPDTALVRFCRLLDDAGVLADAEVAVPGDRRRAEQLFAVREGVPTAVNRRVALAKQNIDVRIEKTAADMIVPFDRFSEMMAIYRDGYGRRNLDYAVWGHISDGNVHPNVIPRSAHEMHAGQEAIREFGREVARLGGCPLAEHGVGRSRIKQALLRNLYGDEGIDQMRRVKLALDPDWKLASGVLFSATV